MNTLPVDIHILILPLLTSASLISLSQTNQHFRQLINPQRKHFLNRLLELECLPEYGGEITINEHAKIIVPSTAVSYACSHCMKLVSHIRFDNHSLLRLRFRKPPPGSRVGQQLCGWTSGDAKAQGLKRQADLRNDTLENWIRHNPSNIPQATLVELYKIGEARSRRTCNECKFIAGFWARNAGVGSQSWRGRTRNSNVGTADVPVVKGRQRRCHDSTERYFWGLFPMRPDAEYPWRWKIYREENCDWWTLWYIRCPGCAVWQERAAFRKGGGYGVKATPADDDSWRQPGWDGPHFEEWRCNRCFAKSAGEQELGKQLLEFWKRLLRYEMEMFDMQLTSGWYNVDEIERDTKKRYSWAQIVKKDNVSSQLFRRIPKGEEIMKMDREKRRKYHGVLKRWINGLNDPETDVGVVGVFMDKHFFLRWTNDYEILEKRMDELESLTKILEDDPAKLVAFALGGDLSLRATGL